MIYLLLITFLVLLFLTYKKFDNDIIAPPVVLVAGYTFSIICASVNVKNWGINLHFNTFFVLVYGTLLFVLTGYLVKKYIQQKDAGSFTNNLVKIDINYKYVHLYIVFQILVMIIWVWNIYTVTDSLGTFNNFSERMVAFRQWNSYSTSWLNNYLYIFLNQFNQISSLSPYIIIYFILNNYMLKIKTSNLLLFSILLSIFQMFLAGGRAGVVNLVFISLLYYCTFYKFQNNYFLDIDKKLILKFVVLSLVGAISFYYIKALVGRGTEDIKIENIIPYLTMYAGGSIQLLDMFLQNPVETSNIWGKEVFVALNTQLIRLGILDIAPYISHLEFRTATTGAFLGNVYTAYRSYIYDFGFLGLTILPVVFSFIVNLLYYNIITKFSSNSINLRLLFYALLFPSVFFDFARCIFYSQNFSFLTIKQFIFLVVLTTIFVKGFSIKDLIKRVS